MQIKDILLCKFKANESFKFWIQSLESDNKRSKYCLPTSMINS